MICPLPSLLYLSAAVALTLPLGALAAPALPPSVEAAWQPRQLLLSPRAGVADADLAELLRPLQARARRIGTLPVWQVELPAHASETAALAVLKEHHALKYVELNRLVGAGRSTNDPFAPSQWNLAQMNLPQAWDWTFGERITIAILDSGINRHPDLVDNLLPGINVVDNNTDTTDVHGHGTWVAGVAAARSNNGVGVAGIAGGARLLPVRIAWKLADGTALTDFAHQAAGLAAAADAGARVANISYCSFSSNTSETVKTAAQYFVNHGGLAFWCAGNDNRYVEEPAVDVMPVVAATQAGDTRAPFSNYGPSITLSAPGNNIITTNMYGGYDVVWGTSFASPAAAATAALVMSVYPALGPSQVLDIMEATAVDLGTRGYDRYFGAGRVDAGAAVAAAAAMRPTYDTTPPTVALTEPKAGATLKGQVAVDVQASDNVGVKRVELWVDGMLMGIDEFSPYQFLWPSTRVGNGSHTLAVVAYDLYGRSATTSIKVLVSN